MSITLIANSGVQYYRFEEVLNETELRKCKVLFREGFDNNRQTFWPDLVVKLPGDNSYYATKSVLKDIGAITNQGLIDPNLNISTIDKLTENQFYELTNIKQVLNLFEKKWMPIPFFKKNNINQGLFGPTDWVRIYYQLDNNTFRAVLAIDTTITKDVSDSTISPVLSQNPNENTFSINSDDELTLLTLDKLNDCEWLEHYIFELYKSKKQIEAPYTNHIAYYLLFCRILKSLKKLPAVHLATDTTGSINVDIVVDIGNSNTCTLLFENQNNNAFNLNSVKKLELVDFTNPQLSYSDSFSTRVAFKKVEFLSHKESSIYQNNKFKWNSPARIGTEAENIINSPSPVLALGRDVKYSNSSPKRYLWDNRAAHTEWEFYSEHLDQVPQQVYSKGVSELLQEDGTLLEDETEKVFGLKPLYSRKSLMTFVFLEIFCQASRQMNSIEFRNTHGNINQKRVLRRVIISCPTAMIAVEQQALRKCAEDAVKLLGSTIDNLNAEIEVVPTVKDLSHNLQNIEKRKDWIYDEATSAQLVFLYGLIINKFDSNPDLLFNLFGKKQDFKNNKSLTIGSLDIGGGTADLMICKYDYKYENVTQIIPEPFYWESFNLAGDDLLKELVQQIIIEGKIAKYEDENCSGVIRQHLQNIGLSDAEISIKLNGFFGKNSNNFGLEGKLMRTSFLNQISLPIAYKYLAIANDKNSIEELKSYDDLFPGKKPNAELLNYFNNHFGFRFESLKWKLSPYKVNEIIQSIFHKLIKQVAEVMHQFSCDLILLSGRPCSFNALEELVLKHHPISPSRLFNMNNYWIGRWYPFSDDSGFIKDPKTVVAVGSLIAYMSGKQFRLHNFRIDTTFLRQKLISTADYIGTIRDSRIQDSNVLLTPQADSNTFHIQSIPVKLGMKRINSENYPARNLYILDYDKKAIELQLKEQDDSHNINIDNLIEQTITKYNQRLPFEVSVSRDFSVDKENVKLEGISDSDGGSINKSHLRLTVQTLPETQGYWLDTGEFILSV